MKQDNQYPTNQNFSKWKLKVKLIRKKRVKTNCNRDLKAPQLQKQTKLSRQICLQSFPQKLLKYLGNYYKHHKNFPEGNYIFHWVIDEINKDFLVDKATDRNQNQIQLSVYSIYIGFNRNLKKHRSSTYHFHA